METLLLFCGGWKGWTSEQALAEDLNYIATAKRGHMEMLYAIFGKPEGHKTPAPYKGPPLPAKPQAEFHMPVPDSQAPPLTPFSFDHLFGDPKGTA